MVRRWTTTTELKSNFFVNVDSWDGLGDRVRLEPGNHSLTLIVDPLDNQAETNEFDNRYRLAVILTGEPDDVSVGNRAPDLTFPTPTGWAGALVASTVPGATESTALSADQATYLRVGISNQGPISTNQTVWVHWYLDDQVFKTQSWSWAMAAEQWTSSFDELGETLAITPGEHTLRLVIDPGNTIAEADETNNTIEATLTWADGPVDAPEAPQAESASPPDPLGKPNLTPYWRFGWGGPIMLSTKVNSNALDPVIAGADQEPYIRLAITNDSLLGANAYDVDLYFDDEKIEMYEFSALTGGTSKQPAPTPRCSRVSIPTLAPTRCDL